MKINSLKKHAYLFQGYSFKSGSVFFAWRVTWNYAYSYLIAFLSKDNTSLFNCILIQKEIEYWQNLIKSVNYKFKTWYPLIVFTEKWKLFSISHYLCHLCDKSCFATFSPWHVNYHPRRPPRNLHNFKEINFS